MLTLSTPFCEHNVVTRKKPKPAYHHGNLRAELIDCGLRLIQEKGIRALTLREIGTRLGVSRSAAYRHFADKAALLSSISEAGFIEFGNALETAKFSTSDDFRSRLQAMGAAYLQFASEHRAHFEVMFGEPPEPGCPPSEAGARAFGILEQTIREGQERGEVRAGDSTVLARCVWAMVHGASMLQLDSAPGAPPFNDFSSEILMTGLASATPV
jgi:AcrR family transcriptional regulator